MEDFKGKTAIITGATSGVGRASAIKFAKAGAKVAAVGRNAENLAALQSEIEQTGGKIKTIQADVTIESDAQKIVDKAVENFGQIDILLNAAGIIANGTIENTELSDWDKMMNVNLRSVFVLTQMAVPFLEKTKGNIVNVSSVAGTRSFPGVLAYCVSKAAIDQFTRCVSLELAPKQIRINAVNPGVVVTELHKRSGMEDEAYAAFLEKSKQTHPIGRVGTADEVADLILFLASERASWITGVTYAIDGGRSNTAAR
jgi:NAD(P)-dependent dehydrogenase (short-subunit alcohol dehydrogenase family)